MQRVREYQKNGKCLQVQYLSPESQNEFISECSNLVEQDILLKSRSSKYFTVIVDVTLDSSHIDIEWTTFLLRYVNLKDGRYQVQEHILMFADCSNKCEEEIAQLFMDSSEEHVISLSNCRVQAYDNATTMAGKYSVTQAKILEQCSMAIFSPLGCYTLNLCGNDAAEYLPEAITYFGTVQIIYLVPALNNGNYLKMHRLFSTWHVTNQVV